MFKFSIFVKFFSAVFLKHSEPSLKMHLLLHCRKLNPNHAFFIEAPTFLCKICKGAKFDFKCIKTANVHVCPKDPKSRFWIPKPILKGKKINYRIFLYLPCVAEAILIARSPEDSISKEKRKNNCKLKT